jgi:hypothetical protein
VTNLPGFIELHGQGLFRDFSSELNRNKAEYMLLGGYALAIYWHPTAANFSDN